MANRNEILAQIVDSAQKDLEKMAMQNPDDNKKKFPTENPDSFKIPPKETVNVTEKKAEGGLLRKFENVHTINSKVQDSVGAAKEPTAPIKKEEGLPFTKVASEESIIDVLKQESQMLAKEASVADEEIDAELEKIAMDSLLELAELEKTAEEFGVRAAQAFLEALNVK